MNFSFIFFPRSFTLSLFNLLCPTTSFISKKNDVTFNQLKRNCFWALKELNFLQCWRYQDAVREKITFTRPVEPWEWRKYVYLVLVERLVVVVGWPTTLKGYDYELFWRKLWCNQGWRKLLWRGKSNVKVTTVSQGRTPSLICLKHYAAWGSGMPKLLWSKQGGGKQSQGPCGGRTTLTAVEIGEVNLSVIASSSASWTTSAAAKNNKQSYFRNDQDSS